MAKLSPHSVRLEREYHITKRLYALPEGPRYVPHAIDFISLVQDGLSALIYVDIEPMDFLYFECDNKAGYYSIAKLPFHEPLWDQNPTVFSQESLVDLPTFLSFAIETCSALQFLHENGVIHGELRPTAFQCVSHRDPNHFPIISSKIWNFGGGSKSYEEFLLKSSRWKAFMNTDDEPAIKQNDFLAQNKLSNRVSNDFCSTREFQTSLIYVSPVSFKLPHSCCVHKSVKGLR